VKYVPSHKNSTADGLSRRPATKEELEDQQIEPNIDDFIAIEISYLRACVCPVAVEIPGDIKERTQQVLDKTYLDKSEQIAQYLTSFRRPKGITLGQYKQLKKKALNYIMREDQLFRRGKHNDVFLAKVLDRKEDRQRVIKGVYEELAYKGREATYHLLRKRYY
jgi:hypothetical protein